MILFLRRISLTIITFLTILAAGSAQVVKNYEKEWKKADDLITKKQPRTALAEVKKIYALAKKDGSTGSPQEAQLIKSLIYISGLQEETREDNEELAIKEMEKEIGQYAKRQITWFKRDKRIRWLTSENLHKLDSILERELTM